MKYNYHLLAYHESSDKKWQMPVQRPSIWLGRRDQDNLSLIIHTGTTLTVGQGQFFFGNTIVAKLRISSFKWAHGTSFINKELTIQLNSVRTLGIIE